MDSVGILLVLSGSSSHSGFDKNDVGVIHKIVDTGAILDRVQGQCGQSGLLESIATSLKTPFFSNFGRTSSSSGGEPFLL